MTANEATACVLAYVSTHIAAQALVARRLGLTAVCVALALLAIKLRDEAVRLLGTEGS